jgi:hypothetical protein
LGHDSPEPSQGRHVDGAVHEGAHVSLTEVEHETLLLSVATMHERRGVVLPAEALLEQTERLEDWIRRKRADAQLAELVLSGELVTCVPEGLTEPTEFVRSAPL